MESQTFQNRTKCAIIIIRLGGACPSLYLPGFARSPPEGVGHPPPNTHGSRVQQGFMGLTWEGIKDLDEVRAS